MRDIAILAPKSAQNLYTLATIRTLCKAAGVREVPEPEAGALWVSLCDPDDISILLQARKLARGRPVIMGGFEAWYGVPYLAWADAIVVGEGQEFIDAWGRCGADAAMSLPCVLTMERYKRGDTVIPSYQVPYSSVPLLRLPGKERYYFLAGRGCKGKCSFCATSWTQPHTQCPDKIIKRVVRYVEERGGKLNLISNDSEAVERSPSVNAQSVRVVDYLKSPERYKSSMLHFGIEFWDEHSRSLNGKPIKDSDICDVLRVTKEQKQKCEFFFIVGYPGWSMDSVRDFADSVIVPTVDRSPAIHIKCTYLDPCPHTPLSDTPVSPEWCDIKGVFAELNSRNKRIRVFPTRSAGRSAWRTALHRCTPEEVVLLPPEPKDTNKAESFERFKEQLSTVGMGYLLHGSRKLNELAIRTRIK